MLNTFPTLLSYALLVPFLFRICLALFLIQIAGSLGNKLAITTYFSNNKYPFAWAIAWLLQIFSVLCAIMLALGLYTQITALVTIYVLLSLGHVSKHLGIFRHSESTFAFASLISFSLLFLGAGSFALDVPL